MPSDFSTEADGKYTIRVGRQNGRWVARAFRGQSTVTTTLVGADRTEAVALIRAALADLRASRRAARGADGSPSADEYREAFNHIGDIHPNHRAMLKAHLDAPDHLITATQLAQAAGYPNWNAANLQYGLLAQRLAEALDYEPPRRNDGSPIWTASIATWAMDGDLDEEQELAALMRRTDQPHFEWLMRPAVREAVRDL